jgi:hypothetical protein
LLKLLMYENWNTLFFYLTFFFSLLLLFGYNYTVKQNKISSFWLLSFFFSFILFFCLVILVLNFRYGKFLLYYLFKEYNIQTVLRDPQEILDLLFGFAFWIFLLFLLIFFLFYIHLFITNILRKEEYIIYRFFQLIFIYFIVLSLLLFTFDLLSFHTDVFSQQSQFKFEPDILKWYHYYESEYFDLFIFFLMLTVFYVALIQNKYSQIVLKNPICRFLPLIFFLSFFLYFFGGESFSRDFIIFIISFIFGEILNYTSITFSYIKRYK